MENCLTCSDAKILFACDLDNTLIHSHKRRRTGDICVEYYVDQEQSFMSPKALDLLKKISERVLFVPVTTRSINQYRRIFWTEDFLPRYAVVANGAYFLRNDKQENFLREVVSPYVEELETQQEKFSTDDRFNICRIVDESFLFLRCRDEIDADKLSFNTSLTVQHTGKKIYFFPPNLNKGAAINRLIKKFSPEKIFCAGDSEIDLPMLELADVAFAPKNLCGKNFVTCSDSPDFAEEFLQHIFDKL